MNNVQGWIRARTEEKENDKMLLISHLTHLSSSRSLNSRKLEETSGNFWELLNTFDYFWNFQEFSVISEIFRVKKAEKGFLLGIGNRTRILQLTIALSSRPFFGMYV